MLLLCWMVLMLTECGMRTHKGAEESQPSSYAVDGKFLISNKAVGHFELGPPWRDLAKNDYGYEFVQEYGVCVDACCDGGFLLGDQIVPGEQGKTIRNPELTIGAMRVEIEPEVSHPDDPNLFFVPSANCDGWYHKDMARYIIVHSGTYRIREGIGVGSTLKEVEEKFGPLKFYAGFIEEDPHALQVVIREYPNLQFVLDVEDYSGNWTKISSTEMENSITISDFRSSARIRNIILGKFY